MAGPEGSSPSSKKTVCIIGSGSAGLAALKESVQGGLAPTCYEMSGQLGGMWDQKTDPYSSPSPNVWDNLVVNNSKNTQVFSDFPLAQNEVPIPSWRRVLQYMHDYADHFQLNDYIHYNTAVVKVCRANDHDQTGRWSVYTKAVVSSSGSTNCCHEGDDAMKYCTKEVFDHVFVCSGYHRKPKFPPVKGLDTTEVPVTHSFYYKNAKAFDGEKVMVVGNSFSAVDIAEDVSMYADKVVLALGQGTWILPQVTDGGKLFIENVSRSLMYAKDSLKLFNELFMNLCNGRLNHVKAKVQPTCLPISSPVAVGDFIQKYIMTGKVEVRARVESLNERSVKFSDGTIVEDIDRVIFATGFYPQLDFVDEDILQDGNRLDHFQMMYPLNRKYNTLVFIGVMGLDGPFNTVVEIQARLAVKVATGEVKLPSQAAMKRNVDFLNDTNRFRRGSYVYYLPTFVLSDQISQLLGVYPIFWKIFWRDPLLAHRVWYGPVYPFHYRLLGPGSDWDQARANSHVAFEDIGRVHSGVPVQQLPPSETKMAKVGRVAASWGLGAVFLAGSVALISVFSEKYLHVE